MRSPSGIREHIACAARTLADAGIDSAHTDAELLAVHLTGVDRGRLAFLDDPGPEFGTRYHELVEARARRIPLQHLTGTAPFGPVFLDAMSKDFKPVPVGWNDVLAAVPQERLQDKDWLDFAAHVLSTLVPAAVEAMQGTKDFTDPASVPDIAIPPRKDKGWFTSALNFAATAAKIVVPLVLVA